MRTPRRKDPMSTTHLEHLARHEGAVKQAREMERERERELAARTRDLTQLHADRLAYEHGVGAGADRDPKTEARFAELNDADVIEERQTHGTVWKDRRAEARLSGARAAREAAEEELRDYAEQYRELLEAELLVWRTTALRCWPVPAS